MATPQPRSGAEDSAKVTVATVHGNLLSGAPSMAYTRSALALNTHDALGLRRINSPGCGYLFVRCGTMGVVSGRNECVSSFLARCKSDYLLFIDADMGFERTIVDRLVATAQNNDLPIVGGLCFAHRRNGQDTPLGAERNRIIPTLYRFTEIKADEAAGIKAEIGFAPILSYPRGSLVQVDATGAAMLLIRRDVLEMMAESYGPTWFDTITHPEANADGTPRTFGEDLSFCMRAGSLNIPVHVDTGARTSHDKGGVFLDEDAYDAQLFTDKARADGFGG